MKNEIKIFEDSSIRTIWDEDKEDWYLSIVDVIAVLTESTNPQAYWRKLKQRLKAEGNETVTNCHGLKMLAKDGKMRKTDVADTKQLFRLIQSVPSPKAEPFKLWLAQIASERLDELQDPELTIDRALKDYLTLGYSENWIKMYRPQTNLWSKHSTSKTPKISSNTIVFTRLNLDTITCFNYKKLYE